jgi:hypothetical protein
LTLFPQLKILGENLVLWMLEFNWHILQQSTSCCMFQDREFIYLFIYLFMYLFIYLFIYCLLNDTISSLDYVTEWLTNDSLEMDVKGSGHSLYQVIIPVSAWRTKEGMKNWGYIGESIFWPRCKAGISQIHVRRTIIIADLLGGE